MRIGTLSLNINAPDFNYGAMLHSWAFQQYLRKSGNVEFAEIIDYTMPYLEGQDLKHPIWYAIAHHDWKSFKFHLKRHRVYNCRYRKFQKFIKHNMVTSQKKYTQESLNTAVLPYDCVICESDVIWSPNLSGGHFDRSFFLALDSMRMVKKIAYAPSMGDGKLTEEQAEELKGLLKYPDLISCRESYEKGILEKYTSKTVTHVLDPVLLLDPAEYYDICADRMIKEDYLLLYLPVNNNKKLREHALEYAKKNHLRVLEISTKLKNYENEECKCIGDAGIEEFISAIRYASCVFTNSFHAVCFSILFHVQFYAFSRKYPGKVKDICKSFGIEERFFEDDNFIEQLPINFVELEKSYSKLREQSMNWLNDAIAL